MEPSAAENSPHLFRYTVWGPLQCTFELRSAPPPVAWHLVEGVYELERPVFHLWLDLRRGAGR